MPSIRRPNTPARIPPPYFLGGPRSELTFNSQWVSKDINRIHDEIPEDEPGYCGCSICKKALARDLLKAGPLSDTCCNSILEAILILRGVCHLFPHLPSSAQMWAMTLLAQGPHQVLLMISVPSKPYGERLEPNTNK
ncbi:hypothetical protein AYX15_01722 [Cryptococcus neoformans]|nr:hypothetical protein AYX15_01722 [Cryptococcus neoformans var. grubii]